MKKLMLALLCSTYFVAPLSEAKEIKMIFGLSLRPYVIKESNSGFEVDIIREALAFKGHTLRPVYEPFSMIVPLIQDGSADGAQRGAPELEEGKGFYYAAEPTVVYQDYAISLKKSKLKINSIADLKDKSVGAFQTATKFLGPDYAAVVNKNPQYQESPNQSGLFIAMYAGRIQVVVSDINIFKFYKASRTKVNDDEEVVYHKIFPNIPVKTHHAVFVDKRIRDDFNLGLKNLKASGRYREIVGKYIKE